MDVKLVWGQGTELPLCVSPDYVAEWLGYVAVVTKINYSRWKTFLQFFPPHSLLLYTSFLFSFFLWHWVTCSLSIHLCSIKLTNFRFIAKHTHSRYPLNVVLTPAAWILNKNSESHRKAAEVSVWEEVNEIIYECLTLIWTFKSHCWGTRADLNHPVFRQRNPSSVLL